MQIQRILYIITKSNWGGAQRYVFDLAHAMHENGHTVAVASASTGRLVDTLSAAGITHIPINSFQRDVSLSKEFTVLGELREAIAAFNPDVVHLNSSKAGGIGAVAARLEHIDAIVFTAHGWPFLEARSFLWRSFAWCGSWATALLCHRVILVSEHDKASAKLPAVKHKMTVVKNGISQTNYEEQNVARHLVCPSFNEPESKSLWLGTIAELNHNKNLCLAIDAVAAYNSSHDIPITYSIIGEGEQRTELQARIDSLGQSEHITLVGQIDDASKYLKAFDVFLLPSLKEGLPYVVLEAGAASLATIGSRVGGIPEIIIDGESGLLFNPATQSELTECLKRYAADAELRQHHGVALSKRIQSQFSLEQMVAATTHIYSSMMDRSGAE